MPYFNVNKKIPSIEGTCKKKVNLNFSLVSSLRFFTLRGFYGSINTKSESFGINICIWDVMNFFYVGAI